MIVLRRMFFIGAAAAMVSVMCGAMGPNAGSETTSGVKIASSGDTVCITTVPGTTLMIFNERYSPGDTLRYADTAVADSNGQVAFTGLSPGLYNIFAYPEGPATGAAVLGFPVSANSIISDSARFADLKAVTGTVTQQGQPDSLAEVFLLGSLFYAMTDHQGNYRIEKVPPGTYKIIARNFALWGPKRSDTVKVTIPLNDRSSSVTVNLTTQ